MVLMAKKDTANQPPHQANNVVKGLSRMYVSEDTTCLVRQIMMVDDGAYHQVKKKMMR